MGTGSESTGAAAAVVRTTRIVQTALHFIAIVEETLRQLLLMWVQMRHEHVQRSGCVLLLLLLRQLLLVLLRQLLAARHEGGVLAE